MAITKMTFDPEDGFLNSAKYPDPTSESDCRTQFMTLPAQLRDYINNNLLDGLSAVTGAECIGTSDGTTLQVTLNGKIGSTDIKALRINADGSIEYTKDNTNWQSSSSSGHIIMNSYGDSMPQRTRMQILNTVIEDDGTKTIIHGIVGPKGDTGEPGAQGVQGLQGVQGEKGPTGAQGVQGPTGPQGEPGTNGRDGNSFTVRGRFNTYAELVAVYPSGQEGWAYAVGTSDNNVVYNWDVEISQWVSLGKLQGPAGPTGPQGETGPQGAQGIQGIQGVQGIQGETGPKGPTGEAGAQGPKGDGVPTGGTIGQILAKNSDTSMDTVWKTLDGYTKSEVDTALSLKADQTSLDTTNATKADKSNSAVIVSIPVASWDSTTQTATIDVANVTATSNNEILPLLATSADNITNNEALQAAGLQDAGQSAGKITLYATSIPTVAISIRVIVRGDA